MILSLIRWFPAVFGTGRHDALPPVQVGNLRLHAMYSVEFKCIDNNIESNTLPCRHKDFEKICTSFRYTRCPTIAPPEKSFIHLSSSLNRPLTSVQELSLNLPAAAAHPALVSRAVVVVPGRRDEAAAAAEAGGAVAVVDLHRQARKRLPPPPLLHHRVRRRRGR